MSWNVAAFALVYWQLLNCFNFVALCHIKNVSSQSSHWFKVPQRPGVNYLQELFSSLDGNKFKEDNDVFDVFTWNVHP